MKALCIVALVYLNGCASANVAAFGLVSAACAAREQSIINGPHTTYEADRMSIDQTRLVCAAILDDLESRVSE